MYEIQLHVADDDGDLERLGELTRRLRAELLELDLDSVSTPETVAPDGAKGTGLEVAELIATTSGSLLALVDLTRSWSRRNPGAAVTIAIDKDKISVRAPTAEQQDTLIKDWIDRHGNTP